VFFQFSILLTIDNAPRKHLIANKARFSLFFVFILATSGKAYIISENLLWEISANAFFPDAVVWIYVTSFFCSGKVKMIYLCVAFLHTVLRQSFTVFAAVLQHKSLYVLRGNIFSRCLIPFPAWFAFNCFFVVRRLFGRQTFHPSTRGIEWSIQNDTSRKISAESRNLGIQNKSLGISGSLRLEPSRSLEFL